MKKYTLNFSTGMPFASSGISLKRLRSHCYPVFSKNRSLFQNTAIIIIFYLRYVLQRRFVHASDIIYFYIHPPIRFNQSCTGYFPPDTGSLTGWKNHCVFLSGGFMEGCLRWRRSRAPDRPSRVRLFTGLVPRRKTAGIFFRPVRKRRRFCAGF